MNAEKSRLSPGDFIKTFLYLDGYCQGYEAKLNNESPDSLRSKILEKNDKINEKINDKLKVIDEEEYKFTELEMKIFLEYFSLMTSKIFKSDIFGYLNTIFLVKLRDDKIKSIAENIKKEINIGQIPSQMEIIKDDELLKSSILSLHEKISLISGHSEYKDIIYECMKFIIEKNLIFHRAQGMMRGFIDFNVYFYDIIKKEKPDEVVKIFKIADRELISHQKNKKLIPKNYYIEKDFIAMIMLFCGYKVDHSIDYDLAFVINK